MMPCVSALGVEAPMDEEVGSTASCWHPKKCKLWSYKKMHYVNHENIVTSLNIYIYVYIVNYFMSR